MALRTSPYPAHSYIIIVGACYTIAVYAYIIIVHVCENGHEGENGKWKVDGSGSMYINCS